MSSHNAHSMFHFVKHLLEILPRLRKHKNPLTAAVIGFFFGPIGTSIYFRSFIDFFIGIGLVIMLFILIPGIGIIPGWIFNAAFAYYRAEVSNERGNYH